MALSAGLLALFAVVGGVLVAGTETLTRDRILEQQRASLRSTLNEVLPAQRYSNALLDDTTTVQNPALLGSDEPITAYRARRGTQPVAVLFPVVAPDGYSGDIRLLVGILANGELAGVRVLNHRETPGLGDAIETRRSDWIRQFAGLSLDAPPANAWTVRKDGGEFDQFAGATITPRAVIKAVRQALVFFEQNQAILFADTPATP
ncbi:MAG: electron transport complex subunit RsxG [Xanthomonadales bacterium]|nr:electron transport complex subunit RsxG [Xanthomonadales bacterium]